MYWAIPSSNASGSACFSLRRILHLHLHPKQVEEDDPVLLGTTWVTAFLNKAPAAVLHALAGILTILTADRQQTQTTVRHVIVMLLSPMLMPRRPTAW